MKKKQHGKPGGAPPKGQPALRFGPGDLCGFTPTGITGFQDLRPEAVVRELVQNSLDAAVEAKEPVAQLRFRLQAGLLDLVPGINEYRDAFERAVKSQKNVKGQLPDQAMAVVRSIEHCLSREECEILTVEDNGIGLNNNRMRAVLADGISEKGEGATGAFGNGHVVAMPASDLRYVLYGGVLANGHRFASGHAIVASHEGNQKEPMRSKDGYFVKALHANNFRQPYEFVSGDQIPDLIAEPLRRIRREWTHGSCVVIPGFNRFRLDDNTPIWVPISKAIATNFFAAIEEGSLSVEMEDGDDTRVLDSVSLEQVLWENSDERRSAGKFLAGRDAYEAYKTVSDGSRVEIGTGMGKVRMCLRVLTEGGRTRVGLCRNGMWVTKDIPTFYGKFSDRQPFQCVILLDQSSGELHRLIREAEGPLHNELSTKYLTKDDRRNLRKALNAIREKILEEVPRVDASEYRPDDILTVETTEEAAVSRGGGRPSPRGRPTSVKGRRRRVSTITEQKKKKLKTKKKAKRGRPIPIEAVSVPISERELSVTLMPKENCPESEVRLILDENVDATCDDIDGEATLVMESISIDGVQSDGQAAVKNDQDEVIAVRIGSLSIDQSKTINIRYRIPSWLAIRDNRDIVAMVEVRRIGDRVDGAAE